MNQEEALNIQQACRDFGRMHAEGKMTLEAMDYELSVLSLEFLDDYGPEPCDLPKPIEMHEYEGLSEDDLDQMSATKSKKLIDDYFTAKKKWNSAQDTIRFKNASNLEWLKKMLGCLEAKNHIKCDSVRRLINQHEIRGWSKVER